MGQAFRIHYFAPSVLRPSSNANRGRTFRAKRRGWLPQFFSILVVILSSTAGCKKASLESQVLSSDSDTRFDALSKLSKLPSQKQQRVAKVLAADLKNADSRVVNRAANALSLIGDEAITELAEALKSQDAYVRITAASALGRIGPSAEPAVRGLIEALKDPHPLVREEAALSLGQIGPKATDAIPALREALRDINPGVQQNAELALRKISEPRHTQKTSVPIRPS